MSNHRPVIKLCSKINMHRSFDNIPSHSVTQKNNQQKLCRNVGEFNIFHIAKAAEICCCIL